MRVAVALASAALIGTLGGCATPLPENTSQRANDAASPSPSATQSGPAASPDASAPAAAVPVAPPTHLAFPAAGIDGVVDEYTAADAEADGGINPPRLDSISWYSGIDDALAGSHATNTVYLFGHTWTQPAVFNGLRDVEIGDEATVTTQYGVMTYSVNDIITMSKSDFSEDPRVAAVVPGRLALVSCFRPNGLDADAHAPDNIVVLMHLVGARPLSG